MPDPTNAQLRLLLGLVASGGEGYGAALARNPQTIRACRDAGWLEYRPVPGNEFEIGTHVITEQGRLAVIGATPNAYLAAQTKAVEV